MNKHEEIPSQWYLQTELAPEARGCTDSWHCEDCKPNGDCHVCETIDGRWVDAVNCYASTCDCCAELAHHDYQRMDPVTQLGYCPSCIDELPPDIKARLEHEVKEPLDQEVPTEQPAKSGPFLW